MFTIVFPDDCSYATIVLRMTYGVLLLGLIIELARNF